MKISLVFPLLLTTAALAAPPCSIRPPKETNTLDLPKLAKIERMAAQKTAISSVDSTKKVSLESAELEIEDGCLVWNFDLKLEGEPGIVEVMIDAGDGKILLSKHESAKREAREKAKDDKK